jgi:hypothetical protein
MNQLLIRRMINNGYSNQDIVERLRCKVELVEAIRQLMITESTRSHIKHEDDE